jgi:hypothetical protein
VSEKAEDSGRLWRVIRFGGVFPDISVLTFFQSKQSISLSIYGPIAVKMGVSPTLTWN